MERGIAAVGKNRSEFMLDAATRETTLDAPPRRIVTTPEVGGLHHRYERVAA